MRDLRYLQDKIKSPGPAPFVTHATYPVEEGAADLWVYELFPGVHLMVTEFACESCFQDGMEQDVVCIHHCAKGRFECVFDSRTYVYMGEGDVALNSMLRPPIGASFPLRYYYGSPISLIPEACGGIPELSAFGISAGEIFAKYSLGRQCRVFRRSETVERIYREIYDSLSDPDLSFLRLKTIELLYYFQNRQTVLEENRDYVSKSVTEKIKRVKERLLEDTAEEETRPCLQELAVEQGLSLTQLKTGFKQIYGETPYAYRKRYQMHWAAALLTETDQKIGEIALEIGYQNASKFADAFRDVMGVTPLCYRKQYRNRESTP